MYKESQWTQVEIGSYHWTEKEQVLKKKSRSDPGYMIELFSCPCVKFEEVCVFEMSSDGKLFNFFDDRELY